MAVAEETGEFELVSVDSMQVYRGMNIGTAKPTLAERQRVPHHLLDLVDPDEEFTLAQFQQAARLAIAAIEQRGKRALLVGGTGLYLQAIVDNFELPGQFPDARAAIEQESDTRALYALLQEKDAVAAGRMEPDNRRRIVRALEVTLGSGRPFSSFGPGVGAYPETPFQLLALRMDASLNAERIEKRVDAMFEAGLVDEVRALDERFTLTKTAKQALGYKEILQRLDALELDTAADEIKRRTRSFARRQRVWFRRDPRMTFFDVSFNPLDVLPVLLGAFSRPE
jgi:tRNA dimethylallyltransferase